MPSQVPGWIQEAARDITLAWATHREQTVEKAAEDIAAQIAEHLPPVCANCDQGYQYYFESHVTGERVYRSSFPDIIEALREDIRKEMGG